MDTLTSRFPRFPSRMESSASAGCGCRGLTRRLWPFDTTHTPCRDFKPKDNQRTILFGSRDLVLVHDGVTVAVQATGIIRLRGKVVLTSVEWRIVVHRWQQTTILRRDEGDVHDESTHQDHDTMHPAWNQQCKDPGPGNCGSIGPPGKPSGGHIPLTRVSKN